MVTYNPHEEVPEVINEPHQHAFVLVGEKQIFGVHMTQYHCELHKYQVIIKLSLPDEVYRELLSLRNKHSEDTLFLCNEKDREGETDSTEVRSFSIPQLGSGEVKKFTANIFQGIRPLSPAEIAADSHFFPWSHKYVKPVIAEFEATVERIVTFRPLEHHRQLPDYATYLLFGDADSGEAHMTNLQTASLVTSPFEPQVFGPDYDSVTSLAGKPKWLDDTMLEAGIVVTTPIVRLIDPDTGLPTIPPDPPFKQGDSIDALYRGIGPARTIVAGPTYLHCTEVCNSPRFFMDRPAQDSYLRSLPEVIPSCHISPMPKRYWAFPEE